MKVTALNLLTLAGWGLFAAWGLGALLSPSTPVRLDSAAAPAVVENVLDAPLPLSASEAAGKVLFETQCQSCHARFKDDGDHLERAAERVPSRTWLYGWIRNPDSVLRSGDRYASDLVAKWNRLRMPAFSHLSNEDIDAIFTYLDAD